MSSNDSLLDVYIYENLQLLEQLESLLLNGEKKGHFTGEQVDAIFRILHTIKGSSAMMNYDNLAKLSHAMEDLFAYIRDNKNQKTDHRKICDLIFSAGDFIKGEIEKVQGGAEPDENPENLLTEIHAYYEALKSGQDIPEAAQEKAPAAQAEAPAAGEKPKSKAAAEKKAGTPAEKTRVYKAKIFFQSDCKMENVRAFGIIKSVEDLCSETATIPDDVLKEHSEDEIVTNGFSLFMNSAEEMETLKAKIAEAFFIRSLEISDVTDTEENVFDKKKAPAAAVAEEKQAAQGAVDTTLNQRQNYMSVRLEKLDKLMDLVGEIVITETTVTKNPEVLNLHLDSFEKAARQLRKLTDELQDTVMSIRMIPISATFHKLERIVRDMSKKIGKNADLLIAGEDTELDKNVIDNLSDPLMHIIRNCMDHGIEPENERIAKGKDPVGRINLEARNTGGDVIITIADDGKGLNKAALIKKGIERGLVKKPEAEVSDKEAYSLIFAPGFSTKETVTEFSGRGVGMDVALKNIERMGGSLTVDSVPDGGMTVQIRIPLTLAIIDGMQVGVAKSIYIIPLLSIMESFKPGPKDVFTDPDGNEMILIRGNCYPVLRLHRLFGVEDGCTNFEDGILVLLEGDAQTYCLFVDKLIGEQQTVIKPMPLYISKTMGWIKSIAGCTILGDGSISLILDINGLMS